MRRTRSADRSCGRSPAHTGRRALGAAIGRVEVERAALIDADSRTAWSTGASAILKLQRDVAQVAVDLVCAGEDQRHAAARRRSAPAALKVPRRLTSKSSCGSIRLVVTATWRRDGRPRQPRRPPRDTRQRPGYRPIRCRTRPGCRRSSHLRFSPTPGRARASRTATSCPSCASRSARLEPMKPAPPVIRTAPAVHATSPRSFELVPRLRHVVLGLLLRATHSASSSRPWWKSWRG
jgi:hypothetical protein